MLTRKQLEEVENYLFSATMNELPNVLGRVLPWMFAEMRILLDVADQRTQEFFHESRNAPRTNPSGHHGGAKALPREAKLVADQHTDAAHTDSPAAGDSQPVPREQAEVGRPDARGTRGEKSGDSRRMDEAESLETPVGRETRAVKRPRKSAKRSKQTDGSPLREGS